jgi:hypothetical protein
MLRKIGRLLVIKKRWEAYAVIYALAVGATSRGVDYLADYPGPLGYLFFLACTAAVFMAGAKILDATQPRWRGHERRDRAGADRRRLPPYVAEAEQARPAFFRVSDIDAVRPEAAPPAASTQRTDV